MTCPVHNGGGGGVLERLANHLSGDRNDPNDFMETKLKNEIAKKKKKTKTKTKQTKKHFSAVIFSEC